MALNRCKKDTWELRQEGHHLVWSQLGADILDDSNFFGALCMFLNMWVNVGSIDFGVTNYSEQTKLQIWNPWIRVDCVWHPTPVLLPGKSHGWKGLVGCSPRGCKESDTTERLHFHFSLSCIGEGNGNPLQCSCLDNPRDKGAWWAAIYGVAQSRTRLKQLSSRSSSSKQLY